MKTSDKFYITSTVVSTKQMRNFNFFWIGYLVYTLSYTITRTTFGTSQIYSIFQVLGLLLMIIEAIELIHFKIENKYLRFIYFVYCSWLFSVIVRGFSFLHNYTFLREFLLDPYHGLLYLAPLILLFPLNFVYLKRLFDVIIIVGIFYIIYDILFIKDLLNSERSNDTSQGIVEKFSDLSFSCGFITLTYAYQAKKKQLIAIGVVIIALLFAIIRARRGLTFMYSNIILISYILYFFKSKIKLLLIYLTIFIAVLTALFVSETYKPQNSRLFGNLVDRGDEDTRTFVELYFYDDMKINDWIFGKGINGSYFCPNVDEDQVTNNRYVIETGYEQTILKSGLISIALFLLIAIPAIINGLFYSKNSLSKAAAIWIFMSQINSYPATTNAFTLQYLLVWISISICYSKEIRNMQENILKNILKNIKYKSIV